MTRIERRRRRDGLAGWLGEGGVSRKLSDFSCAIRPRAVRHPSTEISHEMAGSCEGTEQRTEIWPVRESTLRCPPLSALPGARQIVVGTARERSPRATPCVTGPGAPPRLRMARRASISSPLTTHDPALPCSMRCAPSRATLGRLPHNFPDSFLLGCTVARRHVRRGRPHALSSHTETVHGKAPCRQTDGRRGPCLTTLREGVRSETDLPGAPNKPQDEDGTGSMVNLNVHDLRT